VIDFVEFFAVGLFIRCMGNGGSDRRFALHQFRQLIDGDFMLTSDVDDFTDAGGVADESVECGDGVPDVEETPGLCAVAIDGDGQAGDGLVDESWGYHSVYACLAGTDDVEKTNDPDF